MAVIFLLLPVAEGGRGGPRVVSTHILQPVQALLAQEAMTSYQDDLRMPETYDSKPLYLTEFASRHMPGPTTSGGPIILRYGPVDCPVELPAGRQLMVSILGPWVDSADMILPMEPMTWDEMQGVVAELVARFDRRWTRAGALPVREVIHYDHFSKDAGPKWARVGQWRSCDGLTIAHVSVRHYNSMTGSSFTPPAALSAPLPPDAPDRFLMRAYFSPADRETGNRMRQLIRARRAAEGVDPAWTKLPASIWLDDPDWRPEGWPGDPGPPVPQP